MPTFGRYVNIADTLDRLQRAPMTPEARHEIDAALDELCTIYDYAMSSSRRDENTARSARVAIKHIDHALTWMHAPTSGGGEVARG